MQKIILTTLALIAAVSITFGQTEEATTKSGKKVILNQDGTWKYQEEKKVQPATAKNSECSNYIETREDKTTGKKTTSGKNTIIISTDGGKKGFGILLMKSSSGSLIISIQAVGTESCIDEGNKINILFTDGSKLELANDGKLNCRGNARLYFGGVFGKIKQLEELKTKRIQTMRVWTNDSFVEKDFTQDNSDEFFYTINCLTKKD